MKHSVFYFIGSILLFLGLLWMLLPHAFHSQILQENEPEQQTEHYLHILQGLIVAVSGLYIMLLSILGFLAALGRRRASISSVPSSYSVNPRVILALEQDGCFGPQFLHAETFFGTDPG